MKHFIINKNSVKWIVLFFTFLSSYNSYAQIVTFSGSTTTTNEGSAIGFVATILSAPAPISTVDYTVT